MPLYAEDATYVDLFPGGLDGDGNLEWLDLTRGSKLGSWTSICVDYDILKKEC